MVTVGTTKPERSTIADLLPEALKDVVDAAPAFPSGQALEIVKNGGSEVTFEEVYKDGGVRVNRYETDEGGTELFVWKRDSYGVGDEDMF